MAVKKLSMNKESKLSCIDGAYISGLIMGWASRLEKESEPARDVINDMNDFSKHLAKRSGVTLFNDTN